MYYNFLIQISVDGHLGFGFQVLATIIKAAMNIYVQYFVPILFWANI